MTTDPLTRNALREAWVVLGVWTACAAWALGVCASMGYGTEDEPLRTVLGFPAWIFHGIVLPWAAATLFTIVWGLFVVRDDPLGEERSDG